MSDSIVKSEVVDGTHVIQLDDGKANAISHALLAAVNAALDKAEADADAIVLLGRDGRFSGGFDLSVMNQGGDAVLRLVKGGAELGIRLLGLPKPVVIGCTGHAIAMGSLLLLCADTRIGAAGAFRIGLNETRIGMTLPGFALELARERLSKRHLTRATVQAELYGPDEAVDAGYLDRVAAPETLREACLAEAAALAELAPGAYAGSKARLRAGVLERLHASLGEFPS